MIFLNFCGLLILYSFAEPFFVYSAKRKFASTKELGVIRSWILTLFVAAYFSIESIFNTIPAIWRNISNIGNFTLQDSSRSVFACDLFIALCITDIFLSLIRQYDLKIVEGLIHHVFYIVMLSYFKKNNFTNSFWLLCWNEIPTFLLALQHLKIFKMNRKIFAIIFLFIRVFAFLVYLCFFFGTLQYKQYVFTFPWAFAVLCAHLWWGKKLIEKL